MDKETAARTSQSRVLHVVRSLEPGGMENGVVNVANLLHGQGVEVKICCLVKRGEFADRLKAGIEVEVLGKEPGFQWGLGGRLRKVYERWGADVIHTHNLGTLMYAVLARLGRGFGLGLGRTRQPVILHGEHAQLPEEEKRGKRFRQRRVFYGFTRGIHVVSHGMREDFGRAGFGVGDWHVVVNGVDVEKFRPRETGAPGAVRGELGLSEREVVLGLVGRYGPFKGHLRLLRAFERLAVDRPELRLVFVGDGGPEREAVTEAVGKSAVRDQIIQVGYQAEMKGYYQALDLLVVPSLNEGLSNAVLEAMSCGVPVLAHPACGNGDVLGDGREGYLREMGDAGQVTRALEEVLADRANWAELGAGGRRKAVEEFGIAGMAANYLKLYRQLSPRREPSWGVADGENALRGAET